MPADLGGDVLIAALSGRALAASARRAGFRPLVADLFGDDDTRDLADASEQVPGSIGRGLSHAGLIAALDRLAAGREVRGLVYGSGFEGRPKLLATIARRFTLLGNTPQAVAGVKEPARFALLCARLDIPHPDVRHAGPDGPPTADGTWLAKRAGGSGGGHVVLDWRRLAARRRRYFQRRAGGIPVSAAFLGDGSRARVIATTRQWSDPTPAAPFRYGGAVRPCGIGPEGETEIARIVARLVEATGLRGLNSADFLVRADGLDLLEVNPRPGATLDLLDGGEGAPFAMHVAACQGDLPQRIAPLAAAAAAMVVYAPVALRMPRVIWPAWSADRQPAETAVARGAPICTVLAQATDAVLAERLVRGRAADILAACGVAAARAA